jgi:hypothetical protein
LKHPTATSPLFHKKNPLLALGFKEPGIDIE